MAVGQAGRAALALALAVLGVVALPRPGAAQPLEVVSLRADNFEHQTQAASGQTTGHWCVLFVNGSAAEDPLQAAAEEAWAALAGEEAKDAIMARVDVATSAALAKRFNVTSTPSALLFRDRAMFALRLRGLAPDAGDVAGAVAAFLAAGYEASGGARVPPEATLLSAALEAAQLLKVDANWMLYAGIAALAVGGVMFVVRRRRRGPCSGAAPRRAAPRRLTRAAAPRRAAAPPQAFMGVGVWMMLPDRPPKPAAAAAAAAEPTAAPAAAADSGDAASDTDEGVAKPSGESRPAATRATRRRAGGGGGSSMASPDKDTLDRTVAFLQKREGIDKALKIIRYASRLVVALSPPGSETRLRFEALQSSVGTSRKAYRLGKFLQGVNGLRRVRLGRGAGDVLALAEAVALAGEGTYYFLDQFIWLMKAGFLPKHSEAALAKASAWAELLGYAGSVALSLHKLAALERQAAALQRKAKAARKDVDGGGCVDGGLLRQLELVRLARVLRLALICQDLADSMGAINDLADGRIAGFNHPVVLSVAGLLSAAVSTYKYWGT
ncbi:PEX11A [Scenedesmus sp. PABB004]|nr:PEX11A [Scenedesmus sp. PABB004]